MVSGMVKGPPYLLSALAPIAGQHLGAVGSGHHFLSLPLLSSSSLGQPVGVLGSGSLGGIQGAG
jgi:hypothetical protein